MTGRIVAGVVFAVFFMPLLRASADVVELRGGERVEGVLVKEAGPAGVVIELGGQSIRFETTKVRAIYFGSPAPATAPSSAAPAPPAQPPLPPSSVSGALQLLQSLRSAVAGGTTLPEYAARVNETLPLLELYLAAQPSAAGSNALRDAMRYYLLAELAWSNQGTASRTVFLKKDDALARCSAYQEFAREMRDKGEAYYAERMKNYLVIADGVIPVLWSCAADKLSEAENLSLKAKN
jgi:hypothetical protein